MLYNINIGKHQTSNIKHQTWTIAMKDFLPTKSKAQTRWFELHGDWIWELLCADCSINHVYTYNEAAKLIFPYCGPDVKYPGEELIELSEQSTPYVTSSLKALTRYISLVVRNIEAEYLRTEEVGGKTMKINTLEVVNAVCYPPCTSNLSYQVKISSNPGSFMLT